MDRPARSPATPGIVLLTATALALVLANTPWRGDVAALWAFAPAGGPTLASWVNNGLMTVFFLVVGIEIRREISGGELSTLRRAALPLAAAVGGMLVPAAIYMALNHGRAGAAGWAIPMATDIAFAVGVLAMLGGRVIHAQRILLLALAVIDDIGAIVVIAVFYTGITDGFHPALAGVVVGLLIPRRFGERLHPVVEPWVVFGVMPLFALVNAGVTLGGVEIGGDHAWIWIGIVAGLVIGKPVGIIALARIAGQPWSRGLVVVGLVGGIGFTMSLFVATLAFPSGPLLEAAKLGILAGSGLAMVIGLAVGAFRTGTRP